MGLRLTRSTAGAHIIERLRKVGIVVPGTSITFEYLTGIKRSIFHNVCLMGSWNEQGRYSDTWTTMPMQPFIAEDGCPAWQATVSLDDSQIGWIFHWGVVLDGLHRASIWGIPTEWGPSNSTAQHRDFRLERNGQVIRYRLTHCRRLGANKYFFREDNPPAIRFSVWAPNAQNVETVIGETASGYIWSDGRGVQQSFSMARGADGIWQTDPNNPRLNDFAKWDHQPYMFRVTRNDGSVVYRTDLYSRCQIGGGKHDPEGLGNGWNGTRQDLDGSKSCSVVIDPEQVTKHFRESNWPENEWLREEEFWAHEFDPLRPLPALPAAAARPRR